RRSVSIDEEFDRPLVVGYLAFDRQVLPDGLLGPPIHTLARVQGTAHNRPYAVFAADAPTKALETWYRGDPGGPLPQPRQWMQENKLQGVLVSDFLYGPTYGTQRAEAIKSLSVPQ